ncbi:MAG TPA: sulfite exporter TauE/SafE family protein [Clostridiales bacterium]|nr:sulfite exporter TauE/SafE family protein [Clostridiales bacterium]
MTGFLVGAVTGILSGFGIGGGSLLILWLTLFTGTAQYTAAGINLLYFLCCAPAALLSHLRHHLVKLRTALWCAAAGCVTAPLASMAAGAISSDWLRRLFGVLLLVLGVRELFGKTKR